MSRNWGRSPSRAEQESPPVVTREVSSSSESEEELTTSADIQEGDLAGSGQLLPTLTVLGGSSYNIGKTFRIDRDEMILGRWSKAAIRLDDRGVSRRHAKLSRQGTVILLTDLDSKNGTFCNGERVSDRELEDRDKIQLGTGTLLRFAYKEEVDEAVQRALYESSMKDLLTDAYNKRFFLECLNKELALGARRSPIISLMMVDIDDFKRINDSHGHQAGDYVLSRISRTIRETIRVEDTLARYGGDEMVLLLREVPLRQAVLAAERIRKRIEGLELHFGSSCLQVTVSIGVATKCGAEYPDSETFIRAADEQLYRAKEAGRNRVEPSEVSLPTATRSVS